MALLVSDILRLTHLKNMHVEAGAGGLNRYVVTAGILDYEYVDGVKTTAVPFDESSFVISSLLFMAGHSASTPQTIVIYGIMSAGLAITYYKTERIEYSMGVHILNNSISVLLSLFV